MKRSFLLFTAVAGLGYVTLSSYSSGPANGGAGNRTGSPGSNGTCASAGCHSALSANTTGQFMVAEASSPTVPVTSYIAGHTYVIAVTGNNANKPNFGFQAIALKQSNNTQAGTITATDAKTHVASGFSALIEHNQPIGKAGVGYAVTFNWVAPAAGTGAVKLYGIINAVNGDGTSNGDEPSNAFNTTLTETLVSVKDIASNVKITAFPNPAVNDVNIKFENAENGIYTVKVMDVTGRTIQTEQVNISGSGSIVLQTANWASGLHFAQVMKDGAQRMIPIVKN